MFYMSHEWQNSLQDQVIWSIQQANFKEKNPETTTDEWDKTWRRTESYKWHFNIKILLMKWHIECVLLTWCVVTAAVFAGTESVWHVWLFGIHLIPCGGTNTHTDTHTDTHRHTQTQSQTNTHTHTKVSLAGTEQMRKKYQMQITSTRNWTKEKNKMPN